MPITWRNVAAPQNYAGPQQYGQGVRTVMEAADNLVKFGQQEQRNNIGQLNTAQTQAAERSLLDIASLSSEELQQRQEAMRANPEQFQERYGDNFGEVNEATQNRQNALTTEARQQAVLDFNAQARDMGIEEKETLLKNTSELIERFGFEGAAAIQQQLGQGIDRLTQEQEQEQLRQRRFEEANQQTLTVSKLRSGEWSSEDVSAMALQRAQEDPEFMDQLLNNFSEIGNIEDAVMNYSDQMFQISQRLSQEDTGYMQNMQSVIERDLELFDADMETAYTIEQSRRPVSNYGSVLSGAESGIASIGSATNALTSAYSDQFENENQARGAANSVIQTYMNMSNGEAPPEAMVRRVMDSATVREGGWFRNARVDPTALEDAVRREMQIFTQERENFEYLENFRNGQIRDRQEYIQQNESILMGAVADRAQNGGRLNDYVQPEDIVTSRQFSQERAEQLELQQNRNNILSGNSILNDVDLALEEDEAFSQLAPEEISQIRKANAQNELQRALEAAQDTDDAAQISSIENSLMATLEQLGDDASPAIKSMFDNALQSLNADKNYNQGKLATTNQNSIEEINSARDVFNVARNAMNPYNTGNSFIELFTTPAGDELTPLGVLGGVPSMLGGTALGLGDAVENTYATAGRGIRDFFTTPINSSRREPLSEADMNELRLEYAIARMEGDSRPFDEWFKERQNQ